MKKKVMSILLCLTMVASLLAGCGDKNTSSTPAGTTPVGGSGSLAGKTLVFLVKSAGNPYNERMSVGFKEVVEKEGATCVIKAPEAATAEAQITMINELIAQKVDAIAVAGNDADALQPALKKAMEAGIKVCSVDSAVNKDSRMLHVNQAGITEIGQTLVAAVADIAGSAGGQFAILSATSQATNQNAWIAAMQKELEKDAKNLELVKIAYGDDEFQKSVDETEALIKNYPELKVICAPTTVGIMAAAKVVKDKGLQDKIKVTGLGLPSEMADYIGTENVCPYMFLWNPIDIGSLAAHTSIALVKGEITGKDGDKFKAGSLGEYTVVAASDGGTEIILGPPFKFDPSNIEEWKSVY